MKKLFVVLTGLVLLWHSSFSQSGFNSVYSKDGIAVIAVGDGGNIFMSYDAGATFGSYPLGVQNFNSIFAFNQKVWIVGDAGAIQVSSNGGNSYTSYGIGGGNLNSVYFTDENTGWAVGDGGRIAKTTNSGVTWTSTSPFGFTDLTGVKFTGALTGYACGSGGNVLKTTDGGSSWATYTTGTTMNLLSIDASGTTIIATGVDGKIFKYNGSIWSTIDYKSTAKPEVRSVAMLNPNAFYTCGGGGFINVTTDGGATRSYQKNPMMGPLSDIYMFDGNKGWAVASTNRAILRTNDGGATWQFQGGVTVSRSFVRKQNTSGNIGNPFCQHPMNKNGMFILAGSNLYRSLDKGETWVSLNSSVPGSSAHSFYVNTLDTNLMMASKGSGGSARVIASSDYGVTWYDVINPITLTSYGMPLEVDPNNPNTVYVAPDNGPVRKSTNWGANWTILSGGESGGIFRSPCDVIVQFENPNTLIIGDGTTGSGSGKVWKSTDGGMNWTLINTVSGSEIPMLANSSMNLNLIYHSTWSSGSFWKSLNMGSAFNNLNQSGSLWACDVAKDDPTAVAYDEYGTNTHLSLDEGATFVTYPATSSPAAGVLFFDKSTLLFQHGSGVDKMVITYNVTTVTGNGQISSEIPSSFSLSQNYPNPFNPTTVIKYDVARASLISIKVFDILGNEAVVIVNGNLTPGRYSADFDASGLATGIYFYTLSADGVQMDSKKMILIK